MMGVGNHRDLGFPINVVVVEQVVTSFMAAAAAAAAPPPLWFGWVSHAMPSMTMRNKHHLFLPAESTLIDEKRK